MTTEIAIMNKSAIALAADSAVTIPLAGQYRSNKIYNSANKLFSLSKYAPVGIMTYGNASLMGIPWETIIKVYRHSLGSTRFNNLKEYTEHFFKYLDSFDFGEKAEEQYVEGLAFSIFSDIHTELEDFIQKNVKQKTSLSENDILKQLRHIINIKHGKLNKNPILTTEKRKILSEKYANAIDEIIKFIFQRLPLTADDKSLLMLSIIDAASVGPENQSGIVIAGFGEKEIFPACYNFDVAAVFNGHTIIHNTNEKRIGNDNNAAVMPFAQSDEVCTFMEGVGGIIKNFFVNTFGSVMKDSFPKGVVKAINDQLKLNDQQKQQIQDITTKMGEGAYDNIINNLNKIKYDKYIQPVMQATGFLNKGELAKMAETLVNLVSFRKQVTLEAETVGGPIDVAVITKGDGFIWIKRKHYFDAGLNHHFFNNYYAKGFNSEETEG